jgi:hypothetical protein
MKEYLIMRLNGLLLILISLYGYITAAPDKKSLTAFIGVGIGIILAILSFPVQKENHIVAHIAVVFTLLSAIGLFFAGIKRGNPLILIMAVITALAFFLYIIGFILRKRSALNIKE